MLGAVFGWGDSVGGVLRWCGEGFARGGDVGLDGHEVVVSVAEVVLHGRANRRHAAAVLLGSHRRRRRDGGGQHRQSPALAGSSSDQVVNARDLFTTLTSSLGE